MTRLAALLICLSLVGCGTAPAAETLSVDSGTEVTLAPGETVAVTGAALKVRFVAVTEDSRCPLDVNCVWAGEVKVKLAIQALARKASTVELLAGNSTVAGDYRVTLVRVAPLPVSTAKVNKPDYRATLKIDKIG